MNLQDVIFALSKYWADRGCLIHQPWDAEVGAGTMHPETFLRVLATKPPFDIQLRMWRERS